MPRIAHISIARYDRELPDDSEPLEFLLSIHEEGSGVTWQDNMTVDRETELAIMEKVNALHLWTHEAPGAPSDVGEVREIVRTVSALLYDQFIGASGNNYLSTIHPTAYLLDVDETIINLPWELMGPVGRPISQRTPFGRLVTTRSVPPLPRDPAKEDDCLRILAVINPTPDLGPGERQIAMLQGLAGDRKGCSIDVDVVTGKEATLSNFREIIARNDYDVIHFTGHGSFDAPRPGTSSLTFADGELTANDILKLRWWKPPYLVFNNACESGRSAGSRRLVSAEGEGNGLAAAFMATGAMAYAGHYWPVTQPGAKDFARIFYWELMTIRNLGIAFQQARQGVVNNYFEVRGDLAGYGAVLYGDAASSSRPDNFESFAPQPKNEPDR